MSHSLSKYPIGAILLLWALVAKAHPAPFSYLDIDIDDKGIHGSLVVHDFDAAQELEITAPETLQNADSARGYRDALLQRIGPRLHIALDDRDAMPQWGELQVLEQQQSLRFSFVLANSSAGRLDISARLFPYDLTHQTFVNIYESGALRHQAILDVRNDTLSYFSGTMQGRFAVVSSFIRSGIHHILIGPDHILFLLGLLLPGGTLRKLIAIVTAFTIGHSITLSLAALELVNLPSSIVEPAIALTIVVVGVDNLLMRSDRSADATDNTGRKDVRALFAGAFGLIHGFGFASVLLELGLPRGALGWSLAAFNIGVEIGQLLIVVILVAALGWLYRTNHVLAQRCVTAGSIAVVAAGAFWFLQRVGFISGI